NLPSQSRVARRRGVTELCHLPLSARKKLARSQADRSPWLGGNSMNTRTQSRICLRSLLCFMHTCRFWHHQSPGQNQNNFFGNLVPGGGAEPPTYEVPANFECDAILLQLR